MNNKHPEPQALSDYALGKLDEHLAAAVGSHVADCPECEVTLQGIETQSDTLVAGLREPQKSPAENYAREAAYQRAIEQAANLPEVTAIHGQPTKISAAPPHAPDENLAKKLGPYELLAKLGEGGMGAVYRAQHEHLGKTVAIKILPAAAMRDPALVGRFRREMKAVGALHHPNIVGAHDAGEAGGVHFLVMEYVAGKDLSTILKEQGPLSVEQAISCTLQAARGLEFAHRKGIVHRDIKPANLLLDEEGTLKILDMGLARLDDNAHNIAAQEGLTQSGQVMGTVDYMAPEQAFDTHRADAKADVYSLGCTLYRLLTGQNAYVGDTIVQKILAHREKPIPSLRAVRPEVSSALENLFQRMLAKHAAERIGMGDVVKELAAIQNTKAPATESFNLKQAPAEIAPAPAVQSGGGKKQVPGTWLAAGFGGAAALVLLGIVFIIRDKDGKEITRVNGPEGSSVTVQQATSPEKNATTPVATPTPQAVDRKYTNKLGMEFALIPAGKSWLGGGDGKPGTTEYTQPHDFYLGTTEVTQQQWKQVMGANNSYHQPKGRGKDAVVGVPVEDFPHYPVEAVSSNMALQFIEKLNQLLPEEGWTYRLPTEAEWEYACRGGPLATSAESAFSYYFETPSNAAAPRNGKFAETDERGLRHPTKVASYKPNKLGLYDMHGNIEEWCINPDEGSGEVRVTRGGSFSGGTKSSKAADRNVSQFPAEQISDNGLRVVRVPATAKLSSSDPLADWVQQTTALPAQQQLEAFRKKMIELNPSFDGKLTGGYSDPVPKIENNAVVSLGISVEFVSDIRPLRVFTNLKKLVMQGNFKIYKRSPLSDISPLAGMKLTTLDVYYCSIKELSVLHGMPLESLTIAENPVSDLSPLNGMKLKSIGLNSSYQIKDLSVLRGMPLERLSANSISASDYSVLDGMKLKNISLHGTSFSDLKLLAGMPLEWADLGRTKIPDIAPLAAFATLRKLDLTQMKLKPDDVAALQAKLPNCKIEWDAPAAEPPVAAAQKFGFESPDFAAWTTEVGRRDPETQLAMVLKKLQELNPGYDGEETHRIQNNSVVELSIPATKVADLSPLRALPDLKTLNIPGEENNHGLLKSLAPLRGMKLEKLEFYYTDVADLAPLRGMPLTGLICFGTKVTDLDPLAGMPLTMLWIYQNPGITDLRPLRGAPLEILFAFDTGISDLAPLADSPLEILRCNGTQVSDLTPLSGKDIMRLEIGSTKVTDLAPLEKCLKLKRLDVQGLKLPADSLESLQKALPNCRITSQQASAEPEKPQPKLDESQPKPGQSDAEKPAKE